MSLVGGVALCLRDYLTATSLLWLWAIHHWLWMTLFTLQTPYKVTN